MWRQKWMEMSPEKDTNVNETKTGVATRKKKKIQKLKHILKKKKKKKMKCPGHAEVGEREDQDDPVKGKFNWKETFKADLREGPDNRITIKKLGEKTASQYLVTNEHHKAKEEILTNSKKNISKKCHT